MNKKLKTNLIVGAFGLLIVDRFCLAYRNIELKRENETLKSNYKTLSKHARFLAMFGMSMAGKIRPEEIENAKQDLEFFSIVTDN